jgi:hypothetical protein
MEYILKKYVLDIVPTLKISANYYSKLKHARKILVTSFELEQAYEIILNNFLDLEKQALSISATYSIKRLYQYTEFFELRSILNTRFANLLSSVRFYLDYTPQNIKHFNQEAIDFQLLFKEKCSDQYDSHFEYRFMEALRNHAQHHGTVVHSVSPKSRWLPDDSRQHLEYSLLIKSKRNQLQESDKFKQSIKDEMPEEVDLLASTKKYIEGISEIHVHFRELFSTQVQEARNIILASHKKYSRQYIGSLVGLCAFELENSVVKNTIPLLLDWDDVRIKLEKSNPKLTNLSKRFVTNQIPPKTNTKT